MWLVSLRGARTVVAAAGFACCGSWVVASPSILDQALLGMVPEARRDRFRFDVGTTR
jgi:hypothetical protein